MILTEKRVGRDHPLHMQPLERAKIGFIVILHALSGQKKLKTTSENNAKIRVLSFQKSCPLVFGEVERAKPNLKKFIKSGKNGKKLKYFSRKQFIFTSGE